MTWESAPSVGSCLSSCPCCPEHPGIRTATVGGPARGRGGKELGWDEKKAEVCPQDVSQNAMREEASGL